MSVLERVKAAAAEIRAEAAASEEARQLTPAVVATLRDAGAFGMVMSRRLGGPEVDPLTQLEVIEAVARADGSAGWCTMIGSDGGYATSYLETEVARGMYPSVEAPTALTIAPGGQAVATADGFELSGRWAFSSGCTHAEWLFLDCLVPDGDGGIRMGANGFPEVRVAAVPAAAVEILDTWRTTGLAGSGSHDVTIAGLNVPAERTYSIFEAEPVDPSPLYRHRWMFFCNIGRVYSSSPLDRHRRDLLTMSQHLLVQPKATVAAGRALLGLPPDAVGF